jgi:hypothetical protein
VARIVIDEFGGIAPSVDPRRLGNAGAQIAKNLDLRFGDFRPLRGAGDSVATVSAGTISLHRTPSGVWLHSTTDTDYVDGQVLEAGVERVFLTGRTSYPEVWQSDAYRRLGVPRPPAPPTAVANVSDEFSTDDYRAATLAILNAVEAAAIAARTASSFGNGTPSGGNLGAVWVDDSDGVGLAPRMVGYCVPITLSPTTIVAESDRYLADPLLGGRTVVFNSANYWMVSVLWRASGYQINSAALSTALQAMTKPPENTAPLYTVDQANQIAGRISALFSASTDPIASYIDEINRLQERIVELVSVTETGPARAFALNNAGVALVAAVNRLTYHFTNVNANLRSSIEQILSDYSGALPTPVERALETRSYFFTYVTDRGEESAPSDPCDLVEIDQNDSVQVTIGAPAVTAPYGPLAHWRLYRSSTTNTGAAFAFVAEIPIGTLTYNDSKLQEELGETCPTSTWVEPPADLFSLVGLPNGILAGLADGGRVLCFSEPEEPYAWPEEYRIPLQFSGVALGVFGQTVVVLTIGPPSYVSGADSASMTEQKLESPQACVSKRSVVSTEGGVIYASPDGICIAGHGGVQVVTAGAYSKEDWQALGLASSFAEFSEGVYYLVTEN